MFYRTIFISLLLLSGFSGFPAIGPQQPVKVYLLACFDFQTHARVFDASGLYRQKEIAALSQSLKLLDPDKVFLSFPTGHSELIRTDSLYRAFCNGDSTSQQDARLQIGFRTAKRLRHYKVFSYGVYPDSAFWNHEASLLAGKYKQSKLLSGRERGSILTPLPSYDMDSLLRIYSLKEYLAIINSKSNILYPAAIKAAVWPRLGSTHLLANDHPDFAGAALLSKWYQENIGIYACILNQLDFGEKALLILVDPSRVSILRHLFESNPLFQVMPHDSWLGKSPLH